MKRRLTSHFLPHTVARVISTLIRTWQATLSREMNREESSFILFLPAYTAPHVGKQETHAVKLTSQLSARSFQIAC